MRDGVACASEKGVHNQQEDPGAGQQGGFDKQRGVEGVVKTPNRPEQRSDTEPLQEAIAPGKTDDQQGECYRKAGHLGRKEGDGSEKDQPHE